MGKHSNSNDSSNQGELKKEIILLDGEDNTLNIETEAKETDILKKNNKNFCETSIVSRVTHECPNRLLKPTGRDGFLVVKIPVVISEMDIEINCEAVIKLDQPAVEIKRVKKNVFLTQCKLLPSSHKLFLEGFVRKNIEYAAQRPKDAKGGCLMRHFTGEIPFVCTTFVDYFIPPLISPSKISSELELINFNSCGEDSPEINYEDIEYFNEKIYCELVQAQIAEIEYFEDGCNPKNAEEKVLQTITEKVVLNLRLKLLQNQQVNIYPQSSHPRSREKIKALKSLRR